MQVQVFGAHTYGAMRLPVLLWTLFSCCSLCGMEGVQWREHVLDDSVTFVKGNKKIPEGYLVENMMGTSTEHEPLKKSAPETVMKRVIPGVDGRVRIENTTDYPNSCIGAIRMRIGKKTYHGSGSLIGPHHFLTAGHNVYWRGRWAQQLGVFCALNDDHAPFGCVRGVRVYVPEQFVDGHDAQFDIALVILDQPIGLETGWFGCMFTTDSNALKAKEVTVTGYPGDKNEEKCNQMWSMKSRMQNIRDEKIYYELDTFRGQSGSPILIDVTDLRGTLKTIVVGVHAYGAAPADSFWKWIRNLDGNSGTRLTEPKFREIMRRMAQTQEFAFAIPHKISDAVIGEMMKLPAEKRSIALRHFQEALEGRAETSTQNFAEDQQGMKFAGREKAQAPSKDQEEQKQQQAQQAAALPAQISPTKVKAPSIFQMAVDEAMREQKK